LILAQTCIEMTYFKVYNESHTPIRESGKASMGKEGGGVALVLGSWRKRLLRRRNAVALLLIVALLGYATVRYERLILAPNESEWTSVSLDDLLTDRWYETADGRRLTQHLASLVNAPPMKLALGLYYKEYRHRYAPGIKQTQYIQVGPNQFPRIYAMVTDACAALGKVDGKPIAVPRVYVGWTGKRSFEVTNVTNPSIVIGNDFLWAFTPAQLRYLIARQIGHIQCKHIYLLDVSKGVRSILNSALPDFFARIILGGVGSNMVAWLDEAETTADRAGLLVTGDVDIACEALIKLNIMASLDEAYGKPDPETFAAQTSNIAGGRLASASAILAELKNPNPFLTTRVASLLRFYEANASLFKDRTRDDEKSKAFDPGDFGKRNGDTEARMLNESGMDHESPLH